MSAQPCDPLQFQQLLLTFGGLCGSLKDDGWGKIVTGIGYYQFSVAGLYTQTIQTLWNTHHEVARLWYTIYNKYLDCNTSVQSGKVFDLNKTMTQNCAQLAAAYQDDLPVVSFCTDTQWMQNVIAGYIAPLSNLKQIVPCQVKNIFQYNAGAVLLLYSIHKGKDKDPLQEPMWNQTDIQRFFNIVNHTQLVSQWKGMKTNGERHAAIMPYAKKVAELNGWVEDNAISTINKSGTHLRNIFRSNHFRCTDCYLSVDFEKPDVYFELCDSRGNHIREIKWDGSTSGEQDNKHSIRLFKGQRIK